MGMLQRGQAQVQAQQQTQAQLYAEMQAQAQAQAEAQAQEEAHAVQETMDYHAWQQAFQRQGTVNASRGSSSECAWIQTAPVADAEAAQVATGNAPNAG